MKNIKIISYIFCILMVIDGCIIKKETKNEKVFLEDILNDPDWVIEATKINENNQNFRQNKNNIQYVSFVPYNKQTNLKNQLEKADNITKEKIIDFLQKDIKISFYNFKENYITDVKNSLNANSIIFNNSIDDFYGDSFKQFLIQKITREKIYQTKNNDINVLTILKYNDIIEYVKKQKTNIINTIKKTKYSDNVKNNNINLLNNFIEQYLNGNV